MASLIVFGGCAEVLDFGSVCDPSSPAADLQVRLPDPAAGGACESPWNAVGVEALTPDGSPPVVDVVVDPDTRSSSGLVAPVRAGAIMPLLLTFERFGYPVALWVTSVDLREAGCGDDVPVDAGAAVVWRDPDTLGESSVNPDTPLGQAVGWARGALDELAIDLDHDADGCSNLAEACLGVLNDATHDRSCPSAPSDPN